MPTWEIIPVDDKHPYETCRLKVPGGWLVRTRYDNSAFSSSALALVFLRDEDHDWEIESDEF